MPIDSLSGLNVAMSQFYSLAVAKGVDEELRNQVLQISSSPIMAEASSQFCELVFARRDEFDDELKAIAAEVCQFATDYMFYELHLNQRGLKMRKAFLGQAVAALPDPDARYVKREEEPPPAPIDPPEAPPAD